MGYLITQIIICLLIAAFIGFIIGWLLRGLGCNKEHSQTIDNNGKLDFSSGSAAAATGNIASIAALDETIVEPIIQVPVKSHQIERIEGIGKSIGNSLRNVGVKNTLDLMDKCSTDAGFQEVVTKTNVVDSVVKQWVCMADLMCIPEVDGQYAELLEASDIKSTQDLSRADAEILVSKMHAVNQREHRIPDSIPLPDVAMVLLWIKNAKALPE